MVTICVVMFSVSKISRKVNENWNVEDGHITDVLLGSLRSNEEEIRIVGRIDQMEDEDHRRTNGTRDDNDEGEELQLKVPFEVLFAKLKYLVLSIFTTFVVTLVFPVFASCHLRDRASFKQRTVHTSHIHAVEPRRPLRKSHCRLAHVP